MSKKILTTYSVLSVYKIFKFFGHFNAELSELKTKERHIQMKKLSYDLIDNYIADRSADPSGLDEEVRNELLRDALRLNLTKKQKCYIIKYYVRGMTMQEIADEYGVNRSTVSRTIALARKHIAGGVSSAVLRRALGQSK